MKITVITVAFNSEKTIKDTLLSVIEQDYPNIEHIVIDGGSSDKTAEIVKAHSGRIAYFVSEPDKGIYDAMNKGIDLASGDVIGFLNSDDVYTHSGVVTQIASALNLSLIHI